MYRRRRFLLSTFYFLPVPCTKSGEAEIGNISGRASTRRDYCYRDGSFLLGSPPQGRVAQLYAVTRHFCREAPIPHSFPVFNRRRCRSVHRLELETTTLAARWTLFLSSR